MLSQSIFLSLKQSMNKYASQSESQNQQVQLLNQSLTHSLCQISGLVNQCQSPNQSIDPLANQSIN